MVRLHGNRFATMLNHALIHVHEDVERYKSHMGGLSAYPFENFQRILFAPVRAFLFLKISISSEKGFVFVIR